MTSAPKWREQFGCRRENGRYVVPSEFVLRDVLVRVNPVALDHALQQWHAAFDEAAQCLAIDGKTMCNALDDEGKQAHIMSVVAHESVCCMTQKSRDVAGHRS